MTDHGLSLPHLRRSDPAQLRNDRALLAFAMEKLTEAFKDGKIGRRRYNTDSARLQDRLNALERQLRTP